MSLQRIVAQILRLVRDDEEPSEEYLDDYARKQFYQKQVGRDGHGTHVVWHVWANSIEVTSLDKFYLPAKPRTAISNRFHLSVDFLHARLTRHEIQQVLDLLEKAKQARYVQLLALAEELAQRNPRVFSVHESRVESKKVVHPDQKIRGEFLTQGEFESTPLEFRMSWYAGPDQYMAWSKTRQDAGRIQEWIRQNLRRIPSLTGRELMHEIEQGSNVMLSTKY